jgi:hypothetical protein
MWIRRSVPIQARMPSTARAPGLNPRRRGPAVPVALPAASAVVPASVAPPAAAQSADDRAARAGGFHESSYELQHGLQVSESEWPEDVTVPGALGES